MTLPAANNLEPWTLDFERDGTENIAVIRDADGDDIVRSRPFWMPEDGEPIPQTLAALRLMATSPKLLSALMAASDWIDAQIGPPRTEIQEQIRQAIASATWRAA